MMFLVAIVVASILSLVSAIHYYWALGGLYGIHSAAPKADGISEFRPPKPLIFIVACLIAGLAVLAILLEVPNYPFKEIVSYIGCFVSLVFIIRAIGDFKYLGFFKKVYNSSFAKKDTVYFSPLYFILGLAFAILSKYGS
jgi:hypothetical protein